MRKILCRALLCLCLVLALGPVHTVFLTDQGVLSLALETIRNGVMEGRSSAVGKVRIPLQSVRKVQFNLQNPELRKQRETPFRCK